MRMNRRTMIVVAGLLLGACGESSKPSSMSSGIDAGKTASSLSASEKKTLCTHANDYFMSLFSKGDACKMVGVLAVAMAGDGASVSEAKEKCDSMYSACMKSHDPEPNNTETLSNCDMGLENCPATVGEIETCVNDSGAAMKAAVASIPSCSQITESTLTDTKNDTSTSADAEPASCKTLRTKCPNLKSDQSSTSDS